MVISLNQLKRVRCKTTSSCPDCIQEEFNLISFRSEGKKKRQKILHEIRRDIKLNELEAIKSADA